VSARVTRLDELMALPILGGAITWRPVRLELGIGAFGVNAYTAAAAGAELIEDHDETSSGAGAHEELYVVLRGHARFTVDGEAIDAPAGTLVFVADPRSRRSAVALADDTAALVVGAERGQAYTPTPWERAAYAAALAQRGDHERALEAAAAAVAEHPEHPSVLYNVACAESLAGARDAGVTHLRRAVELDPRCAEWARDDADLDPLREDPGFPAPPRRSGS
jgi:tetratricopeptide (TPR) repeat protein